MVSHELSAYCIVWCVYGMNLSSYGIYNINEESLEVQFASNKLFDFVF